jgi:uncharacterized protein (UPF0276 family)
MEPSPKRTNGMELSNLTNEDAELIRELTAEFEEILAVKNQQIKEVQEELEAVCMVLNVSFYLLFIYCLFFYL